MWQAPAHNNAPTPNQCGSALAEPAAPPPMTASKINMAQAQKMLQCPRKCGPALAGPVRRLK